MTQPQPDLHPCAEQPWPQTVPLSWPKHGPGPRAFVEHRANVWSTSIDGACDIEPVAGVATGARILLRADGAQRFKTVLDAIGPDEAVGIEPCAVTTSYRRTVANRMAARRSRPEYAPEQHAAHLAPCALRQAMTRGMVFTCIGFSLAAMFAPVMVTMPIAVVYNPSDSVPRGWYRIGAVGQAKSLQVGSIVLATMPADAAALAAQRGYLPAGVPILKRIGAVAPQSVCIREHVVRIDGIDMGTARTSDGRRRPLPVWQQCRVLADTELFLLSDTNPASFDSRYFGPITTSAVLGVARPLWTWSTP